MGKANASMYASECTGYKTDAYSDASLFLANAYTHFGLFVFVCLSGYCLFFWGGGMFVCWFLFCLFLVCMLTLFVALFCLFVPLESVLQGPLRQSVSSLSDWIFILGIYFKIKYFFQQQLAS